MTSDDPIVAQLTARLERGDLPGPAAQRLFAPRLSYGRHAGPPSHNARPAAVMALLFYANGDWRVPLTLRRADLVDHGGQVCFPGGSLDRGESVVEAALRELEEEIGVPASSVNVLGQLSPIYLYNTNFLVSPCLGWTERTPHFRLNDDEVAELTCMPLDALLDPKCRRVTTIRRGQVEMEAPYWCWDGYCIWGATAMMLAELAEILRGSDSAS